MRKILSILLLQLVGFLVRLKYGFGTGSIILKSHTTNHLKIDSIHGMSNVAAMYLKGHSPMYDIHTKQGRTLRAADDHVVYKHGKHSGAGIPITVNRLHTGDILISKTGPDEVEKIKKSYESFTFDMISSNPTNTYWSDDIMSHNSVTTAIFMVWYILANVDKTVVCLSQNEDKVTDLIDKIKTIVKNLPYHLKPGVIKWDVLNVQFDNGCKIKGQTTTPNSAAGITADLLYMDEFALVNKTFIKEFYRTAYPAISAMKNSKVIITSTPRGLNKFWEIYDGALKGKNYYNPLRIDWWEVPGRDEAWKLQEIANMTSIEDFNQEYGNQFLAGNSMLLPEPELKKVKLYEVEFVHHDFDVLEEADINYKGILTWHPFFDTARLGDSYFVITIDLGGGGGGDYSVANIHQILPMNLDELIKIQNFVDEKDFFKIVQIGLLRMNTLDVPPFADLCYKIFTALLKLDNFKIVLEINFDGKRFIERFTTVFGHRNVVDEDTHFVKYKHRIDAKAPSTGLKMTEPVKVALCATIKDKIKYNQLVVCEKITTQELLNFTRNDNGSYSATSGHDDCIMTEILLTSFYDTDDYYEFVEELLKDCPEEFLAAIDKIMANSRPVDSEFDNDDYDSLM